MKTPQYLIDKTAIGLSLLCAIHCLLIPLLLVITPSLASLNIHNEAFHVWMVIIVIPTSLYALTMGCKKHQRYTLLGIGAIGLSCLLLSVALGEHILGEAGEKTLTLIGAGILAYGHYRNYRLCQQQDQQDCSCSEHEGSALR